MKRKKAVKLARKYFLWWTKALGLRWYAIKLCFHDHLQSERNDGYETVGLCWTEWEYLKAEIQINSTELKKLTSAEIERVIVHELMHVLLNEMREEGIKHEERVATQLTDAFGWVVSQVKDDVTTRRKEFHE